VAKVGIGCFANIRPAIVERQQWLEAKVYNIKPFGIFVEAGSIQTKFW